MSHDPATLAAVRERVESLMCKPLGTLSDARNDTLRLVFYIIDDMLRTSPNPAVDMPPLTADDVRRIAEDVFKRQYVVTKAAQPEEYPGQHRNDPPPAPPPAKRVEAWALVGPAGLTTYGYQQAAELVRMTGDRLVYLREQHGVTDAASAEAFERNFAWLMNGLELLTHASKEELRACGLPANILDRVHSLAPFLPPDAPR